MLRCSILCPRVSSIRGAISRSPASLAMIPTARFTMKLHGLTPVVSLISSAESAEALTLLRSSSFGGSVRRIHPRAYTRGLLRRRINFSAAPSGGNSASNVISSTAHTRPRGNYGPPVVRDFTHHRGAFSPHLRNPGLHLIFGRFSFFRRTFRCNGGNSQNYFDS
jgi:hypothetical protein